MNTRDLSGRHALVTGAASGIGRATALECARRGADLFVCDIDEAGLEKTAGEARGLGRMVVARRVDVSSASGMEAFAAEVHGHCEAVDLLVNNAGIAVAGGLLDTTLEDWDRIIGVNLRGVVHGCHNFAPAMVRRGRGHVVIVSSMAGYTASEGLLAYCTTKFAVLGLADAFADELAGRGVGVTAICPGVIDTPITRNTPLRGEYAVPGARELMVERYHKRGYTPERVAKALLTAVHKNRVVAPVSPEAWVGFWLARFTPGLYRRVRRWGAARGRREIEAARGAAAEEEIGDSVPKQRLREDLVKLREELERSPGVDAEARELVAEISRDVETLLTGSSGTSHETESLVDRLRSAADTFEESHPSLTAAVGRIADALSALGI